MQRQIKVFCGFIWPCIGEGRRLTKNLVPGSDKLFMVMVPCFFLRRQVKAETPAETPAAEVAEVCRVKICFSFRLLYGVFV